MWSFSKKWRLPDPQLAMIISLANEELPPLIMLANPAGIEGAVQGMLGPAQEAPSEENMMRPMKAGEYVAIAPGEGGCSLLVERLAPDAEPLHVSPDMLELSGLTAALLAKFNRGPWHVTLEIEGPGNEVRETAVFATRLAQRLAALGDGLVMDTSTYRFFGPEGWPVENPMEDFDVREHVHIHVVEPGWFHTHGLIKFGRPELEIYDVPAELDEVAFATLLDIAQYVIVSSPIEPGQTCGDPSQPFYVRKGTKNPDHWEDISVLELVDLDERQKPVASGAPKALQLCAATDPGSLEE